MAPVGKKKAATAAAVPAKAATPEVAGKGADEAQKLRAAADKHFLSKEYSKASDAYEQAAKLLGDSAAKAELLQRSAGCYLIAKRFKEAVKACNATLEQQPSSSAAMRTRAKAYEQLGFFKQALSDVQAVNKGDGASADTREMEQRLKDTMSANKAKLTGTGSQVAKAAPKSSFPYMITVKATLDDETRVVHASLMVSYAELYEAIKAKFPSAGPFLLKYLDKDGDNVTITSRADIQSYLGDIVATYQKQMQGSHGPKLGNNLPAMRLQMSRVSSEAEVPKPPAEEMQGQQAVQGKDELPKQEYEMDEWLVEFARVFSEVTGIDPVAHHEHLNLGQEKINQAMDVSLSDEKAQPLFDKAAEHFKDATCGSIIQWGNVHIIKADRQAQALLKAGKPLDAKALDAMLKEYEESEKKFNEAFKIKPDSWEAQSCMGQLEWERAKAKMGFIVPTPPLEDPLKEGEGTSKADAATAVKDTLAKLDAKKVTSVQKHIDSVGKWFDKALSFAKAQEEKKKEADASSEEKQPELTLEQQQQQQMQSPSGNMLVMHGNILYEWSQVLAAISKEWKPVLDSAVEKFRAAGAAEADIRGALKNHSHKEHLDLGPDPEPEQSAEEVKAPAAKAAEAKAPAPEAKGLPSLEVKKKAKAPETKA